MWVRTLACEKWVEWGAWVRMRSWWGNWEVGEDPGKDMNINGWMGVGGGHGWGHGWRCGCGWVSGTWEDMGRSQASVRWVGIGGGEGEDEGYEESQNNTWCCIIQVLQRQQVWSGSQEPQLDPSKWILGSNLLISIWNCEEVLIVFIEGPLTRMTGRLGHSTKDMDPATSHIFPHITNQPPSAYSGPYEATVHALTTTTTIETPWLPPHFWGNSLTIRVTQVGQVGWVFQHGGLIEWAG